MLFNLLRRVFIPEVSRFIVVGGLNTLLTYLSYLVFLTFLPYQISYSASFALGIVLGYTLSTLIVFREPWSIKKMILFPAVYLVQYVLGLIMISVLVGYFSLNEKVAPLIIVVLLLPITYLMSKRIIKK